VANDRNASDDLGAAYYEPYPLVALDRHVAVFGLIAEETRVICQRAAALCGLPAIDLHRLIEHRAGRGLAELAVERGADWLAEEEARALRQALRDRPFGVVSLSDGVLRRDADLALVRSSATLVSLELDLPSLFLRLRGSFGEGARWHPLEPRLGTLDDLRGYHRARAGALSAARHTLPVRGRSPERLARDLAELLLAPAA
jgi:shikimate kinase